MSPKPSSSPTSVSSPTPIVEALKRARHDLKNPLSQILGFLDFLDEGLAAQKDRESQRALADIRRVTHEAVARVEDRFEMEDPQEARRGMRALIAELGDAALALQRQSHVVRQNLRDCPPTDVEEIQGDLERVVGAACDFEDVVDRRLGEVLNLLVGESGSIQEPPARPQSVPVAVPDIAVREGQATVLIVDDMEANRELLRRRLEAQSYRVELAEHGEIALRILESESVDLILLDLMMPVLNGFETLRRLKDNPRTRDIPVIMLSHADDSENVVECIRLGANDFLPQPFNPTVLLARIDSSLATKRLADLRRASGLLYTDKGTLDVENPAYISREADAELAEKLEGGELCYLLTSRQMGKSSLMARSVKRLREAGVQALVVDLTALGLNLSCEQWFGGVAIQLGRQAGIEDDVDDFWMDKERLSPALRFIRALEDVVAPQGSRETVIFFDEIDIVRSLPFDATEFFAAVRSVHNARQSSDGGSRVNFCLLGVATPTELIDDSSLTPFNIGARIELSDFPFEVSSVLARGFASLNLAPMQILERVFYWTNGHPYLTQRLCRALSKINPIQSLEQVDQQCTELFLGATARESDDNLLFVSTLLTSRTEWARDVLRIYKRALAGDTVIRDEEPAALERLRLVGLLKPDGGHWRLRNRIYQRVFDLDWVDRVLSTPTRDSTPSE